MLNEAAGCCYKTSPQIEGMVKPNAEIYKAFLTTIERPASEVIFFDDAPRNIAIAHLLGIDAHLIFDHDDLKEKYQALNPIDF